MSVWQTIKSSPFGSCAIRTIMVLLVFFVLLLSYAVTIRPYFVRSEQFIMTGIITLAVWLCRRYLDKNSFRSLGVRSFNWKNLIIGFVSVIIGLSVVLLVEWWMGWIDITGFGKDGQGIQYLSSQVLTMLCTSLTTAALTAWREELLFRGYLFKNMRWGMNTWWGAVVSSVLFGFFHIIFASNAAALTMQQKISIVMLSSIAGFLFALAYLRSRALWMPIGLHMGWNFLVTPVFGFGAETGLTLISQQFKGPQILAQIYGGVFGLNAFIILIIVGSWMLLITEASKRGKTKLTTRSELS